MAQVKVIHDVTACIYKINCDKPVSKWSFQTKLEEQQKDKLVERLKVSSGLVERTKELGIFDFKIKLQYKRNVPEAEFPKGRIFAIDSQDQFEEDPVAPSSLNLFCKDAFVVIKPGYQPSRLPEAPFFLGKCKNNVKASERKLTVSIYAQDQLLPFNFVDAQLQCQIEISGILHKAENVRIEDDVVALDEDEYSSCVIDCLDHGDQTTAQESAEIGEDVSEEAEASNEVVQVRHSETTVQTTRSGRTP